MKDCTSTCKDCQHWLQRLSPKGYDNRGLCTNLEELAEGDVQPAAIISEVPADAKLLTHENFGCNQFEAKP